jgi:hypothetical protein
MYRTSRSGLQTRPTPIFPRPHLTGGIACPGPGRYGPVRPSPWTELDRCRDRPPAGQRRHQVAGVGASLQPGGDRGQEPGKLPRHIVSGPARRLVAESEVNVVHLDFPQPPRGARRRRPVIVAPQVQMRPARYCAGFPGHLQPVRRGDQAGDDIRRRARRSRVDLAAALRRSARVARHILAAQRPVKPPGVPVGVGGQMREHMADHPPRQPARRPGLHIGDIGHGGDQPTRAQPSPAPDPPPDPLARSRSCHARPGRRTARRPGRQERRSQTAR